jgi:hypothetical protein
MDRRHAIGGLFGTAVAAAHGQAWAHTPATVRPAAGLPQNLPPDELLYATRTTLDRIGRIMAPVMVNGQGPFRFIIDTGASHSTLAPHLAQRLNLAPLEGQTVRLNGVTGSADVPVVIVEKIEAGSLLLANQSLPVVLTSIMANADGILGVAGLTEQRIEVDFRSNFISISRRRGERLGDTPLRIPARRVTGGMLLIDGRVGRIRTRVVFDTGAERTLGNLALRDALESRRQVLGERDLATVHGATEQTVPGERWLTPLIEIGALAVGDVRVTFGDFHIFDVWKIDARPALILGMDVIGVLDALVIDYRNNEITVFTANARRKPQNYRSIPVG